MQFMKIQQYELTDRMLIIKKKQVPLQVSVTKKKNVLLVIISKYLFCIA